MPDSTTGAPAVEAPVDAPPPRGRRVHASVYAEIRGPNLVKPTVDQLLADGEWVPEYLLVQIAGRKVHFNRAAKSYTAMRKAHHKKTPGVDDERAGHLASEEYRADPDRADTIGRRRVVVNDVLRAGKKHYESRLIAEGRYEGQREWRRLAPIMPENMPQPAKPAKARQRGFTRTVRAVRPPGRDLRADDLPFLVAAYLGEGHPGQRKGYRGIDRVAAERGVKALAARAAVLAAVPPEQHLGRGRQPGHSPTGSAPPPPPPGEAQSEAPPAALMITVCWCPCPCPGCRDCEGKVCSPHGAEEGAAPVGDHRDPERRAEAAAEQGAGPARR